MNAFPNVKARDEDVHVFHEFALGEEVHTVDGLKRTQRESTPRRKTNARFSILPTPPLRKTPRRTISSVASFVASHTSADDGFESRTIGICSDGAKRARPSLANSDQSNVSFPPSRAPTLRPEQSKLLEYLGGIRANSRTRSLGCELFVLFDHSKIPCAIFDACQTSCLLCLNTIRTRNVSNRLGFVKSLSFSHLSVR